MTNEEEVIRYFKRQIHLYYIKGFCKEAAEMAIKAIAQTTWIPVSERLPEKNVKVLATTEWGEVTIAEIFGNGDWFIRQGVSNANADDILAWQPSPESYKENEI